MNLWSSLTLLGSYQNQACAFRVLQVSMGGGAGGCSGRGDNQGSLLSSGVGVPAAPDGQQPGAAAGLMQQHGWRSIWNTPWLGFRLRPSAAPSSRLLHVGQEASLTKAFSAHDVELFAKLTGDRNPLHLDPAYARTTSFREPVVHGILLNGLVSAVIGSRMPGRGHVLLHQEIRFPAPVFLGEEVEATARVHRVKMSFAFLTVRCSVGGKVVMEGEVTVMMQQ